MTMPPYKYEPDYKVHPGATLRETFIHHVLQDIIKDEEQEIVHQLEELMQGRGRITEELAHILEEATKITHTFWLNLQKSYDEHPALGNTENDTKLINLIRELEDSSSCILKYEWECDDEVCVLHGSSPRFDCVHQRAKKLLETLKGD